MISDQLRRAVDRLNIRDVIAKAINCSLEGDLVPGVSLEPQEVVPYRTLAPSCLNIVEYLSDDQKHRLIVYEVKVGLKLMRSGTEAISQSEGVEVVASIEALFLVSYSEKHSEAEPWLEQECLVEFAKKNVPFNVWPYWRELVQTACSRMGLQRVVLPVRHLSPRDRPASQDVMQGSQSVTAD